jgi:hypothetical protein
MATKECITCKVERPLGDFWVQRGKPFGECKICGRARNAAWHRENREAIRPRHRISRRKYLDNMDWAKRIHASAKWRAKKDGTPFTISTADIVVPTHCPVLGVPLVIHRGRGVLRPDIPNSPSLDRIDNALGYVPGNVVVVSYRANRIKCDASVSELLAVADFYRRLEIERRTEGARGGAELTFGRLPPAVPAMFANEAKEEGPLPARDVGPGGDQGVLPPLQLGDDFQR